MNIVDSSGWLAYFADEPNAKHFLSPLKDTPALVVPSVTIYEVFKVVLRESNEIMHFKPTRRRLPKEKQQKFAK